MSDWNRQISDWNNLIIQEFRANGGTVGEVYEGASLLLLTTTGTRVENRVPPRQDTSARGAASL